MTADDRPDLTVVIAATDSPLAVLEALRALQGQGPGRLEILVAADPSRLPLPAASRRQTGEGDDDLRSIRWITAPAGSGVPRLRRLGLEAARGRVVAFTEDSCTAQAGWLGAWLGAFEDPSLIAGSGTVEQAEDASRLDRAVVYCEYAPFLDGIAKGSPGRLAGNNFAALREVALGLTTAEVHETALLAAIRRAGGLVRSVDGAMVRHVRRFGWGEAIGDRLRFGLEFGRLRTVGASPVARWAGLVAGPAIFASQVARVSVATLGNPRHLGRFLGALPITLALLAAWSLGEWLGWSLGPPPNRARSLARPRRGTADRSTGPGPGRGRSPRPGCRSGPPLA